MNEYSLDYIGNNSVTSLDGTMSIKETDASLSDDFVIVENISSDNNITSSTEASSLHNIDEKVDYIRGNKIIVRRYILKK